MKKRLKHIILILISIVALSISTKVEVSTEPIGLYYALSADPLNGEAGDTVNVTFSIHNINSIKDSDTDGIETMYLVLQYDHTKFDIEMSETVYGARNISNNAITIPAGEPLNDNVNINNLFIKNFDSNPGIIDISYLYFYATGNEWLHNDANILTLTFTVKNDVSGDSLFKLIDEGVEIYNGANSYDLLKELVPDISTAEATVNIKGPEAPTSTIHFNSFGVGTYPDITLPIGEAVSAPANPTKQGYSFDGWYESPDNGATLNPTPYAFSTMPENDIYLFAKYTPINYSIKYNSNGGQGSMPSQVLSYDQTASLSNNLFTRTGYNFLGWSTSVGGSVVYPNQASVTNLLDTSGGIVNLYAVWEKVHAVTLDSQGGLIDGSTNNYSFNVIDNQTYGVNLKTPTKKGHTFLGWYTLQTGGTKVISSTKVTSSVTLYAQWSINTYTISFESNGGSSVIGITQTYNSTVFKPNDPTRIGYSFVGWYSDSALNNQVTFPYTMTDSNVIFYAKWQINQYSIIFESNGGSAVTSITKNYNETISEPIVPTKIGFVFDGWYTDITFKTLFIFSVMPANDMTVYARWIEEHIVTFDYNNGSSQTTRIVLDNNQIGVLPTPTKVGYTFDGWYETIDFSDARVLSTDIINSSLTLYAKWNVKSITLTFNSNGGSNVLPITQNYNSEVIEPVAPTKLGYNFVGWYSDSSLQNPITFPYMMPSVNTTLYAKWQINQYTITFESNGGSSVTSITKNYNEVIVSPVVPTKIGFAFDGWYLDNITFTNKYTFSRMSAENIVIYAKWVEEFTVTFEYNNGDVQTSKTILNNKPIGTLPTPTSLGYTFNGWYLTSDFSDSKVLSTDIVNTHLTLFAKWDIKTITLSFNTNGGTSVSSITQNYNSNVIKPTNPTKTGYSFIGWYSDSSLQNIVNFPYNMPSTNTTVYAKWEINQYTINFESNGGSSVNPIIKNFGEAVSAPLKPSKAGFVFDGWYLDNVTFSNKYTFSTMPANDIPLYAKWIEEHNVTFEYNNGDSLTIRTVLDNLAIGSLPSPIKVGYTFDGWYETNDFSGSKILESDLVNKSMTLYAKWNINKYSLIFFVDGALYSEINQNYNTTISYPNIPTKEGYAFDGWYTSIDDGVTLNTKFSDTVSPANNITLYAKWTVKSFTVVFDSVGGSIHNPISSDFNLNISLPVPTKTGYTFTGWYETSNYSTSGYFTTYTVTKDVTLYANWELVGANDTSLKEIKITTSDNTVIKTVTAINNVMTVYVNNSVDLINIIPVALYPSTMVSEINGLSLEVAKTYENQITLTSLSGKSKTYVLNVIRDTKPEITDVLLNQGFDINFDGATNYTLDVAIDIASLEVSIFTNHDKNTVTINGVNITLAQLTGKRNVSLNSAGYITNIIIIVTSLSKESSITYTIAVNRSSKSNNANLINLEITGNTSFIGDLKQKSTGNNGFNQAEKEYTLNVNYEDTSLVITPVFPTGAIATITGQTNLIVGKNIVTIEVVAEDKMTKVKYTIEVNRASPSTSAFLQSVQIKDLIKNQVILTQNILLNETNIFNVSYDVENVVLIPTKDNNSQKATIVDLGTLSLNEGNNDFVIVVVAEDGITVSEYDIRIIRANGNTSNKLASLSVSGLNLNPILDLENLFNYELQEQLSYTTTTLDIEAIKVDSSYGYVTISYNGSAPVNTSTLTINPPIGESNLVITVYPQKGSQTVYRVKIVRKNITGKSELSSLIVKDNENKDLILNPNFNMLILDYAISNVKYATTSLQVTPTAVNEASISSFKVNGKDVIPNGLNYSVDLNVGQNIIEIKVISNIDTTNSKTYTITVNRLVGDDNNDGVIFSTTGNLSSVGNIYNLVLPKSATSFRLDVSKSSVNSKVYISGDNASYKHFDFSTINSMTVSVIITSETGIDNIFTVNVTRSTLSDNANLLNLTIKSSVSLKETTFTSFPINYTVDYKDSYVEFKAIFVEFGGSIDKLGASLKVGMNNILIAATAADGQTYKLYNVNITRKAPSSNNLLESIILSNPTDVFIQYPLNEVFNSASSNYTANVNYDLNQIVISPKTVEDGSSYIIINNTGVLNNIVSLNEGLNSFEIIVTAEDGSSNSYYLSITRQAGNKDATLSDLTLTEKDLNFSSNKFRYPDVDYISYSSEIGSIELFAKTNALTSNIKIKLNGNVYSFTNQASFNINLQIGANIVEVIVTSQGKTTNTYTLYIFKTSTSSQLDIFDIIVEGVKDANLDSFPLLDSNNNEINFDINTLTYYAQIPFGYSNVVITPQVLNSFVEQDSYREDLIAGEAIEISFIVKSEDLNNSKTYTVYVTQLEGDKDNTLKDLQLFDLESNQYINSFDKDTTFYSVEIGRSNEYVIVNGVTNSSKARIELQDVNHNPLLGNIKLNDITNIIVSVYSENGEVNSYIIRVTKTQISDNPFLNTITITDQFGNDLTQNLNPNFSSKQLMYNLIVEYKVNEINITGEGVDKAIIISGAKTTDLKTLSSTNLIEVVSKAEDGQTVTYTILVYRMLPGISSKLKNIKIDGDSISIIKDVYDYTFGVPFSNDKIILEIAPEDINAGPIKINGELLKNTEYPLVIGANNFNIEVLAEDGKTKSNYQLIINRENASSDVKMIDLEVEDAVESNFKEKTNEGQYVDTTFKDTNYLQYIFVNPRDERITLRPKILDTCKVKNELEEITVDLSFGNNVIPITVVAEDEKTEVNYIFVINRPNMNSDTSLRSLTVNNSKFQKINEEVYIVDLRSNIKSLDLSVILNDDNATYEIIGNEKLEFQSFVIVKVTAEDGITTQNYVLYVSEGEETSDDIWKVIGLIAIGLSIAFATSLYMVRKSQH